MQKDMIDYRLDLWQKSQFDTLLQMFLRCKKGRVHSSQLTSTDADNANIFARTIRDGNVKGAMSFLTQKSGKPLESDCFITSKYGEAPVKVLKNIPEKLLYTLPLLMFLIALL